MFRKSLILLLIVISFLSFVSSQERRDDHRRYGRHSGRHQNRWNHHEHENHRGNHGHNHHNWRHNLTHNWFRRGRSDYWRRGGEHSTWQRHNNQMKDVNTNLRKYYEKCIENTKDRKKCHDQVWKYEHKVLHNYHNNDWKYNILRWQNKFRESPEEKKRLEWLHKRMERNQWNSPKNIEKQMHAFREKHGNDISEYNAQKKAAYERMIKLLEKAKEQEKSHKAWRHYRGQHNQWRDSKVGSCIHSRLQHYRQIMKKAWWSKSHEEKQKYKHAIERACKNVANHLPFAHKNCMKDIQMSFEEVMKHYHKFNEKGHGFKDLRMGLVRFRERIAYKCIKQNMEDKPECQKYMLKHLGSIENDILNIDKSSDSALKAEIHGKVEDLASAVKGLVRDSFWLNAPHDCGIDHKNGVPEKIEHKSGGVLNWFKNHLPHKIDGQGED